MYNKFLYRSGLGQRFYTYTVKINPITNQITNEFQVKKRNNLTVCALAWFEIMTGLKSFSKFVQAEIGRFRGPWHLCIMSAVKTIFAWFSMCFTFILKVDILPRNFSKFILKRYTKHRKSILLTLRNLLHLMKQPSIDVVYVYS